MLVQILAENAVKHGIATMVNGGLLSITGSIDGDTCSIVVANPARSRVPPGATDSDSERRTRLDRLVGPSSSIELAERTVLSRRQSRCLQENHR
jgi:LytS/YehU family sensor histidine kinase